MLNLLRKFLKPTLREQLEDGVREALRKYTDRTTAPNLRVFVSTDLLPPGAETDGWSANEADHLRRFALQWAEDNTVPRAGLRVDVVLLDTKREFAFVKPIGGVPTSDSPTPQGIRRGQVEEPKPMVTSPSIGSALLEVVDSPSLSAPVEVNGELILGRKSDGAGVLGIGDRYMSSRHARLHLSGGALQVTDLDSKNRTFLNGEPIAPHQPTLMREGDELRLGTTTLRLARVR